jgi:2-hydroxycyclohexanecarboxyl-CoA dehydrogenase
MAGRVAVVTGGGGGIGAGVVRELASRGADVAVLDLVADPAQRLVGELGADGGRGIALTADVSDRSSVDTAIASVLAEFGRIDILVNNAGHARYVPFREVTEDIFDRMIAVHLKGTFNCTQSVVETMVAQHYGRIVNMASVAALTGSPLHTHYSAAKGGIVGFTKALAKELGPEGITVNAVAPGFVRSGITEAADFPERFREDFATSVPMRRIGEPEDIAAAVGYLSSESAGFVTGQVLSPNGGYVI